MAILSYDANIGYDSTAYSYDGLFLGGSMRLDDLFVKNPISYLTDPLWPGQVDQRGYMTGRYDEERTYFI